MKQKFNFKQKGSILCYFLILSLKMSAQFELLPDSVPMYNLEDLVEKPTKNFYLNDCITKKNYLLFKHFCDNLEQYQNIEAFSFSLEDKQWLQLIPFGKMPHLQHLAIIDTDLSEGIPQNLLDAKKLVELNLSMCKIHTLDPRLKSFRELKRLDLSSNYKLSEFSFNESDFSQLTYLLLAGTTIKQLNPFKKLIFLDMNSCDLIHIPEAVFQMNSLEGIDLSSNHISVIPKSFALLTKLRIVQLQGNCLFHANNLFEKNGALYHLNLLNNSFSKENKIRLQKQLHFVKQLHL